MVKPSSSTSGFLAAFLPFLPLLDEGSAAALRLVPDEVDASAFASVLAAGVAEVEATGAASASALVSVTWVELLSSAGGVPVAGWSVRRFE